MAERCEQIRERFSEYVDGELTPEDRAAVDEHVAGCPECRAELDGLRRTLQAVASLPRQSAPAGLAESVVAGLRAEQRAARPKVIAVVWARALPIAAMLLIVVGLTFMVGREGGGRRRVEGRKLAMSLQPEEAVAEGQEAPRDVAAVAASAGEAALEVKEEALPQMRAMTRVARPALAEEPGESVGANELRGALMDAAPETDALSGPAGGRPVETAVRRMRAAVVAPAAAAQAAAEVGDERGEGLYREQLEGEAPTAPGLHWQVLDQPLDDAVAAGEAQRQPMPAADAAPAAEAALAGRAGGTARGRPAQTFSLSSVDPAATALQIVDVANASGVLVSVGLPGGGPAREAEFDGFAVEGRQELVEDQDFLVANILGAATRYNAQTIHATTLRLHVPVARYDAFVKVLSDTLGRAERVPDSLGAFFGAGVGRLTSGARAKESVRSDAESEEEAAVRAQTGLPAPATAFGWQESADSNRGAAAYARTDTIELTIVIRPELAEAAARSAPAAAEEPAE